MQSGISASAELQAAFNNLVSTPSQRGLLATIQKETAVPLEAIAASSSFESDLSLLTPHIKDNAAIYLILRRFDDAPDGFVFLTYVPNAAPVRQKMLFASTRLSLARELGIERFRETIFATEARELTAEGFKRHDAHVKLEAPLTVEEQSLGEVRRAELEAGAGSGVKKSHLSSHFSMSVADDALSALKALGQGEGGNNLVQLRIDTKTEVIELDSTTSTTLSALSSAISSSEPRYSFFRFSPETIIFIYTCPSGSKIKERMLYASSRLGVTAYAEQEAGITIAKKLEASEPGELSEEAIEEEFRPKVEVKRAFDRPRRPGRR